jgi:DNA-binding SARP family transcriptional activator
VTAAHEARTRDPRVRSGATRLLITAGAGYGKSSLLEAQRPLGGVVMSTVDLVSGSIPDGVSWIGLDDFHRIGAESQTHLISQLDERPELGVAITSRAPLCPALHRPGPGRVCERDAGDLALTPYAVAQVLAGEYGVKDPEAGVRVAELTAGWPALVHFCGQVLRRDGRADLETTITAAGSVVDWISADVIASLPGGVPEILAAVATVDVASPLSQDVCDGLLVETGHEPVPHLVRRLVGAGVLVPRRRVSTQAEVVMVPAIALVLRATVTPRSLRDVATVLAREYTTRHAWLPAARAHAVAGDRAEGARLAGRRGDDMLRGGDARRYVDLVDDVVGQDLTDQSEGLRSTYADALRMVGDLGGARRAFAPLVARAEVAGWTAGLATRVAGLHYLSGDFEAALDALDRADGSRPDVPGPADEDDADVVDWLACRAHVLAMLGRVVPARATAAACLELAERLGRPRGLGVAHLAMARTGRGPIADLHHERALEHAAAAEDVVTATRALQARTSVLLALARYDEASVAAGEAARLARASCPPGLQAAALHNLAEALARTGELGEALWHLECSVAVCRRLGPARAALGLVGIADIHRVLGHHEQAHAAYAEATELSRGSGDVQVLVPALCGRALMAVGDSDPAARAGAEDAVAEALRLADGDLRPRALIAAGRLALARGDRAAAADHARGAIAAARQERTADLLAEALELEAVVSESPRARAALREALSIWAGGGARPDAARIEVLIGRLPDADGAERSAARDAVRDLRRFGLVVPGRRADSGQASGIVGIEVLGPFTVTVDGADVPLTAWRSKQARTLIKILAAHRGRVVTRDRLCDLLWPDDDPARTGHRLSVLLATVRTVLDPTKAWPLDRYIAADQGGVRLDLRAVVVDAERLLADAAHAAELLDRRDTDAAREVLAHVDALHRGEAFEDEVAEWTDGLREDVRAAWGRSVRRLANLQLREGRGPEALGLFTRLLGIDPYDEQVHRRLVTGLVRAGRHGEARRAFDRWQLAMREIDAPPPDPRLLEPDLCDQRPVRVLTPR